MTPCTTRVSLYWLDDAEAFLGAERCTRPSTSWLPFASDVHGTLSLATAHIFFDDGGDGVTVFPLRHIDEVTLQETQEEAVLSFACRRAVRRAVLPCAAGQVAAPGVSVPYTNTETWVFRLGCVSEWFMEALRRLVERQRTDDLLSRRESVLQAVPAAVSFRARRQVPMREQRGVLHITAAQLVFEPLFATASHGAVTLRRGDCVYSFARWIVFEAIGLDLYTSAAIDAAPALSLLFANTSERDQARAMVHHLLDVPPYSVSPHHTAEAWKRGELSNYDYLLILNRWASRCLNDVFQYPVMPWVLADYAAEQLDLTSPASFRDLSKPLGALVADRLAVLRERAQFLDEAGEQPYLYSTHYSSAGVVAYYLVRPHPEFQLCLQGGTLDVAERIMESIAQVWRSVTTNTSNFRELTPEFFNDAFVPLCGPPRIPLGAHGSGRPVAPQVELPPWAADPPTFVRLHRAALESESVSAGLHRWIDLIFGVAQSGELARAADNVFHPFSYRQPTQRQVSVPGLHLSPHEYAREFGNVPMQLFSAAHPSRGGSEHFVACTAEAVEACRGSSSAACTADQRRVAQMVEALQSSDDEAEAPRLLPELSAVEGVYFGAAAAVTLAEGRPTPLACTTARTVALGFAEEGGGGAAVAAPRPVLLVVGDDGCVVTLFDAASGERLRTFPDFDGPVASTAHQSGSVYVFTEHRTCYAISLTSQAVTHCFTELTPAPVVHACFQSHAVLLADAEAQLTWWGAIEGEGAVSAAHALFDTAPACTCEASSRVVSLGGAPSTSAIVAVSANLEAFLFRGGVYGECILRTVPEDRTILSAAAADEAPYFWVFFHCEAVLYGGDGLWLRRIDFPAASAVVCATLSHLLHPLCLYTGRLPVVLRHPQGREETTVELRHCRAVCPLTACAGSTLALLGRAAEGTAPCIVVTLVEVKPCSAE